MNIYQFAKSQLGYIYSGNIVKYRKDKLVLEYPENHIAIKILSIKHFHEPALQLLMHSEFVVPIHEYKQIHPWQIIYTPYAELGDLTTFSSIQYQRRVPIKQCKYIFKQMCYAIKYCRSYFIIHCDIKPENWFVYETGVKLGDFGLACFDHQAKAGFKGTWVYASPEMFDNLSYDCKIDIWGLGHCLYYMYYGRKAFNYPKSEIREKFNLGPKLNVYTINNKKIDIAANVKRLLRRLFQTNPDKRPDIKQVLQSSWLNPKQKEYKSCEF